MNIEQINYYIFLVYYYTYIVHPHFHKIPALVTNAILKATLYVTNIVDLNGSKPKFYFLEEKEFISLQPHLIQLEAVIVNVGV